MKVNKKAVFMLGACYGAFVTISGVIAAKVFNKVLDEKIDKKVGTKCSNNCFSTCCPHNSSYSSPFGFGEFAPENEDGDFLGNAPKGFDYDDGIMGNSTSENKSEKDPDEADYENMFFESED